jgi:Flp pilus assembly protein TadD
VRQQQGGEAFPAGRHTIVNPARLEPALREAVCEQCHLQGEFRVPRRGRAFADYRPGLPLHQVVSVFVQPPAAGGVHKAVSHVEQMHQSRCFREGRGKLGCASCHDPHALPAEGERVAWYRGRCLACHDEAACSLPRPERLRRSSADSCIDCHMPRGGTRDVAHAALTDHHIPRHPDEGGNPAAAPRPGTTPMAHFHAELAAADGTDASREVGLAMGEAARVMESEAARRQLIQMALPLLEAAAGDDPDDVAAWEALGYALRQQGRTAEAQAVQKAALARAPGRELALIDAGELADELGQADAALGYWKRLAAVNPWHANYQYRLARAYLEREDLPQAVVACRRALELQPAHAGAREVLVRAYLRQGDRERARAEFDRLLALDPPKKEELRRWFEEQTR